MQNKNSLNRGRIMKRIFSLALYRIKGKNAKVINILTYISNNYHSFIFRDWRDFQNLK